jgi:RNA recognition motif-containing protein
LVTSLDVLWLSAYTSPEANALFLKLSDDTPEHTVASLIREVSPAPDFVTVPVDPSVTTHGTTVYLTNIPKELSERDDLLDFCQTLDPEVKLSALAGVCVATATDLAGAARLVIFGRSAPFLSRRMVATCNSLEVPVVRVVNVPRGGQSLEEVIGDEFEPVGIDIEQRMSQWESANVRFETVAECDRFIERKNYAMAGGQVLMLSRFVGKDELSRMIKHELIIRNLPANSRPQSLRRQFERFGTVFQFQLRDDQNGHKTGLLTFFNDRDARTAAADTAMSYRAEFQTHQDIVVRNLLPDVTEDAVREIFEPIGAIRIQVMRGANDSPARAKLSFVTYEAATAAARFANSQFVGGLKLTCRFGDVCDWATIAFTGIRIRGLPEGHPWPAIYQLGRQFGQMVAVSPTAIKFADEAATRRAVKGLDGLAIGDRPLECELWYSRHFLIARNVTRPAVFRPLLTESAWDSDSQDEDAESDGEEDAEEDASESAEEEDERQKQWGRGRRSRGQRTRSAWRPQRGRGAHDERPRGRGGYDEQQGRGGNRNNARGRGGNDGGGRGGQQGNRGRAGRPRPRGSYG